MQTGERVKPLNYCTQAIEQLEPGCVVFVRTCPAGRSRRALNTQWLRKINDAIFMSSIGWCSGYRVD